MVTLNQILKEIQLFATNHKQLKGSWFFGDPFEENAKFDNRFPLIFGMVRPSPLHWQQELSIFEIYVCDKPGINKRSEQEILSDTKLIFKDFLSYMKGAKFTEDFDLNTDVTLDPFVESFDDSVSGWSGLVEFQSIYDWDLCSVPTTGLPVVSDENAVNIIDQNNNVIATIPSGGYYTVEVLQQLLQTLIDPAPATVIQTLT